MSTRQKIITPTIDMEGELDDKAWARVAKIMMISSSPYILFRPTISARIPNPTCPMTVPPEVATYWSVRGSLGAQSPSPHTYLDCGVCTRIDHSRFAGAHGIVEVDDTQHGGHQAHGKDIVGIGEETDARDGDGAHMIPAERSLVNLSERKSSSLIGVRDVGVVVVEVVEGRVPAGCSLSHTDGRVGRKRRLPRSGAQSKNERRVRKGCEDICTLAHPNSGRRRLMLMDDGSNLTKALGPASKHISALQGSRPTSSIVSLALKTTKVPGHGERGANPQADGVKGMWTTNSDGPCCSCRQHARLPLDEHSKGIALLGDELPPIHDFHHFQKVQARLVHALLKDPSSQWPTSPRCQTVGHASDSHMTGCT